MRNGLDRANENKEGFFNENRVGQGFRDRE